MWAASGKGRGLVDPGCLRAGLTPAESRQQRDGYNVSGSNSVAAICAADEGAGFKAGTYRQRGIAWKQSDHRPRGDDGRQSAPAGAGCHSASVRRHHGMFRAAVASTSAVLPELSRSIALLKARCSFTCVFIVAMGATSVTAFA